MTGRRIEMATELTLTNVPVVRVTTHRTAPDLNMQLTVAQGRALTDLFDGLVATSATRIDGSKITTYENAVAWLLEQITAQFP
jgi:hypothetical protein